MADDKSTGCICAGNWQSIVSDSEPLLDKIFADRNGRTYTFFGVVLGSDDYYYGMVCHQDGKLSLLSCVGSLDGHGFTLQP